MGCASTKSVKIDSKEKTEAPAGKQEAAVRPLTPTEGTGENGASTDAVTGEEVQKNESEQLESVEGTETAPETTE